MNKSILDIILKEKNLPKWRDLVSSDEENTNSTITDFSEVLIPYLQNGDSYYEYANVVWEKFTKGEDRQSILWIWIEDVFRLDEAYSKFLINLSWNSGNLEFLEYMFDLLSLYYLPKSRENVVSFIDSEFFKHLIQHSVPEVIALSELFAYQEHLTNEISQTILEIFDVLPEKIQEKLLDPIFSSMQDDSLNSWIQNRLDNSIIKFTSRIKTGFLIQILNNCKRFQTYLPSIKSIIENSKDSFLRETVLLYIIPSEIISESLLEPILGIYTNENNLDGNLLLLQYLPQYFDEWPVNLKQKIVKMFEYKDPQVRSSIMLLLSPTWINEELLILGLSDENRKVQDAAIQSAAILFQRIGMNIRNKIIKQIQTPNIINNAAYGFFIGYNYNIASFKKEILNLLTSNEQNEQEKLIQCLRGLIIHWSYLPINFKDLILTNSMHLWTKDVKDSIHENLTMFLSSLDNDGRELHQYLSKQKNFLSVDLDVIND